MRNLFSILATTAIVLFAVLSCTKDSEVDSPSVSKPIVVEQSSVSSFTANITGRFIEVNKADLALGKRGLFYCLKTSYSENLFNSWLEGNDNPGCMVLDRVTVESETMYCTITGLFPDTEYNYCLYLQKRDGTREISAVSSFRTQPFNPEIKEVALNGIQCFVAFVEGNIAMNGKDVSDCETGVIVSGQSSCNIDNSTVYRCDMTDDYMVRARIADLESDKEYYCRSYVKYQVSSGQSAYLYGPEKAFRTKDFHEVAVDLGLPSGLIWASYNVGADTPYDYGDYYAWGETETYYETGYAQVEKEVVWKDDKSGGYDWPNYMYCFGSYNTLTKYCNNTDFGFNGYTDNKTVLDPDDDVACIKWGGGWRMPTVEEMDELINPDYCTWTWTTQNRLMGYKVTSKVAGYTDRSIFLPAAGHRATTFLRELTQLEYIVGNYWSSSLSTKDSRCAIRISFGPNLIRTGSEWRDDGFSVRPVYQ